MRLNKKQEAGIEAACDILSDIAKWGYGEEQERLDLAIDTLLNILESNHNQRSKRTLQPKKQQNTKSDKSKGR